MARVVERFTKELEERKLRDTEKQTRGVPKEKPENSEKNSLREAFSNPNFPKIE